MVKLYIYYNFRKKSTDSIQYFNHPSTNIFMRKLFTLIALSIISIQFTSAQTVTDTIINFSERAAYVSAHPELLDECLTCPHKEADEAGEEEEHNTWSPGEMPLPDDAEIKMSKPLPEESMARNIILPASISRATVQDWLAHVDLGNTIPPDTYGAVGLDHVVTTTNQLVIVHNKAGGAVVSAVTISVFTGVASTCDPQIFIDLDLRH